MDFLNKKENEKKRDQSRPRNPKLEIDFQKTKTKNKKTEIAKSSRSKSDPLLIFPNVVLRQGSFNAIKAAPSTGLSPLRQPRRLYVLLSPA